MEPRRPRNTSGHPKNNWKFAMTSEQMLLSGYWIMPAALKVFEDPTHGLHADLLLAMSQNEALSANIVASWMRKHFKSAEKESFHNLSFSSQCNGMTVLMRRLPFFKNRETQWTGRCLNERISSRGSRRIFLELNTKSKDIFPALAEKKIRLSHALQGSGRKRFFNFYC